MPLHNKSEVPALLALWLAIDTYDYNSDPKYISVTTLIKPPRKLALERRLTKEQRKEVDVIHMLRSRLGTAVHDSVERVWKDDELRKRGLEMLGYEPEDIEAILINPTEKQLKDNPNCIPVYIERRRHKEIAGMIVGGKYDFIPDGKLDDIKCTSTYSWMGMKDEDYIKQLSIYRWLNLDIVTSRKGRISFVFTDWKKKFVETYKDYPPLPTMSKEFTLFTTSQTEQYLTDRITEIKKLDAMETPDLPLCSREDLWQGDDVWEYYNFFRGKYNKTPAKKFKTAEEANAHHDARVAAGEQGKIVAVLGKVKACEYCAAELVCDQRKMLQEQGLYIPPEDLLEVLNID